MLNTDEYGVYRNVPVKKSFIRDIEQSLGGKVLSDDFPGLLIELDKAYASWKRQHPGKDLNEFDVVMFPEYPTVFFKPVKLPITLNHFFPGLSGTYLHDDKPLWVAIQKNFTVGAK